MSFSEQRKNAIIMYLLEKIEAGDPFPVKKTADSFSVTPATVYKYLDRLEADGAVRKIKRGTYELTSRSFSFSLTRSSGELEREEYIYSRYILPQLESLPQNVIHMWDYIAGEMLNNVIDHSEAENVTVTVSMNCLNTTIRFADDGIGIFNKIKNYFNLYSLDEAVGELFKGKLTTDAQHHSGEGIFFSSRLADSFVIISSGKAFYHDRFDRDKFIDDFPAPGTIIYATLSNNSNKSAKSVFDKFADVDGGFTATSIPIVNYFESIPVSRSQAKRLCEGLDKFRTVNLDFRGVEWIGQAFADQIFRVFANEHPEITVIPHNMNDDVRKMYNHVTV